MHSQVKRLTRETLQHIAKETLDTIDAGSFTLRRDSDKPLTIDLQENVRRLKDNTLYYPHGCRNLASWSRNRPIPESSTNHPTTTTTTKIWTVHKSTLETARSLISELFENTKTSESDGQRHVVGVLNFASAKNPGGGFINGSQAQEESIARSSTLYPSLTSPTGQQFYSYNKEITSKTNDGFYSHAMIYSPSVMVFRNDVGDWVTPYEIDVLTSPAVNAGVVRSKRLSTDSAQDIENKIRNIMKERMARLLYLFELQRVRNLVLGSFGTGVFRNNVDTVIELWKELLVGENARFGRSFDRVVFGVLDLPTFSRYLENFAAEQEEG